MKPIVAFTSYVTAFLIFAAHSAFLTSAWPCSTEICLSGTFRDLCMTVPTSWVSCTILSLSIYLMYVTKTAVTTLLFLSLLAVMGQVRKSISDINWSVQRLATDWTVQGSDSEGGDFPHPSSPVLRHNRPPTQSVPVLS